jgi:hypothetical protein
MNVKAWQSIEYESNKKNNKMKNTISQDERNISMTVKEWQGRTFKKTPFQN